MVTSKADWLGAKDQCEAEGGHLLTFPSAASSVWFRNKVTELATGKSGKKMIVAVNHSNYCGCVPTIDARAVA